MSDQIDRSPSTGAVVSAVPDLYQAEMARRLAEWHAQQLEPAFRGAQFLPLLALTVVVPTVALAVGWFL